MNYSELRAEATKASLICRISKLGGEAYITLTAMKFRSVYWRNLSKNELEQLQAILLNRRAEKAREKLRQKAQLTLSI